MLWFKTHWFILTTFVSITTVLANDHLKIQTLEDTIKNQANIQSDLSKLQTQSARTDERTLMILQLLQQQNSMIEQSAQNKTKIRSK